jgi:hypothetical protein
MPIHIENSEFADNLVSLQDLDRDNRGMLQLVVGHLSVEDLNGAVIAGISK